jgi:hypothetical protein
LNAPVRRLQVEFQAALVAPALQFDHPVALPHRVAFHQRQPAGLREQIDQHHRLVIHFEIISTCDLAKQFMPDIGPWRLKRKIVIDLTRHAGSGRETGMSAAIPTDPPNQRKIGRARGLLLQCDYGPAARLPSSE